MVKVMKVGKHTAEPPHCLHRGEDEEEEEESGREGASNS